MCSSQTVIKYDDQTVKWLADQESFIQLVKMGESDYFFFKMFNHSLLDLANKTTWLVYAVILFLVNIIDPFTTLTLCFDALKARP